jgi:RNA polymerase sigma factor (sigma-70 family)
MLQVGPADLEPRGDDALVAAAVETPEAFGLLYGRYAARVFRYVLSRTGSRDEAADLTQLTFARAFKALPRFRPGRTPFVAWLFRIARNAVTDAHRRRRATVSFDGLPEALVAADGLSPEALLRSASAGDSGASWARSIREAGTSRAALGSLSAARSRAHRREERGGGQTTHARSQP